MHRCKILALSVGLAGAASAQDHLGMHRVAEDIYVYTDGDPTGGNPATTNCLVVVTPEGVLVGDGLGNEEKVKRLLAAIEQLTDAPIRYLVNASWHGDHTGANHLFEHATILSHDTTRDDLLADYRDRPQRERAPPVLVYRTSLELSLGETDIVIRYFGRGHTRGDSVIYLPQQKVAFLGELFFNEQFPGLRSAYPGEWVQTLDRVMQLDADIWIPGHGVLQNGGFMRSQLLRMRDELAEMRAEVGALNARGLNVHEMAARGALNRFAAKITAERNLPIAIERIDKEIRGELAAEDEEAAIRRARARQNRAIEEHDATTIAQFWSNDYIVVTSRSDKTSGRDANREGFAQHFEDFPDVVYHRAPEAINVNSSWAMAFEQGTWRGHWTEDGGRVAIGGTYAAKWRKVNGRWLIEVETFVPTFCTGTDYCYDAP